MENGKKKNNAEKISPKRSTEELREDVLAWIEKRPKENSLEKTEEAPEPAGVGESSTGGLSRTFPHGFCGKVRDLWKFCLTPLIHKLKEWKKIKDFVLGVGISVVIGIILIIIAIGVGLYKYQWDNGLVNLVIKVIPYPVALVNNKVLFYSEFREDIKTLDNFYAKQKEVVKDGLIPIPSKEELKQNILDRMIKDKLVQGAVKDYGLKVAQKEVDAELTNIVNQAGSQEEVASTLKELYNWNTKDFQKRVLYPYLLRQKLQKAIQEDENLSEGLKDLGVYLDEQQKKATIYRFIDVK